MGTEYCQLARDVYRILVRLSGSNLSKNKEFSKDYSILTESFSIEHVPSLTGKPYQNLASLLLLCTGELASYGKAK